MKLAYALIVAPIALAASPSSASTYIRGATSGQGTIDPYAEFQFVTGLVLRTLPPGEYSVTVKFDFPGGSADLFAVEGQKDLYFIEYGEPVVDSDTYVDYYDPYSTSATQARFYLYSEADQFEPDGTRVVIRSYSSDLTLRNSTGNPLGFTVTLGTATGAVPEPSTWAMLILGFGLIGGAMRRRHKVKVSYA